MEEKSGLKKAGELAGFLTMFLLISVVLYFSLQVSNRLPEGWRYLHIFLLILSVVLTGVLIKMLLK